ncbi:MAG: hypothetical protein HOE90_11120 [Bacteriovoracaceae bacterium]|nr:hypothetical protein [Bacteriovoracaceae bacterium]
MDEKQIKSKLLQAFKAGEQGHFYILKAGQLEFANLWIQDFCMTLAGASSLEKLHNHVDFLLLGESLARDKDYTAAELSEFFHFGQFAPMKLPYKIIVVYASHLISENNSNKMLKSLEEPIPGLSIFFVTKNDQTLLPTVESRATTLSLKSGKDHPWASQKRDESRSVEDSIVSYSSIYPDREAFSKKWSLLLNKELEFSQLLEAMNDFPMAGPWALDLCLHCEQQNAKSFSQLEKSQDLLNFYDKGATFHTPKSERFFLIAQTLKNL